MILLKGQKQPHGIAEYLQSESVDSLMKVENRPYMLGNHEISICRRIPGLKNLKQQKALCTLYVHPVSRNWLFEAKLKAYFEKYGQTIRVTQEQDYALITYNE